MRRLLIGVAAVTLLTNCSDVLIFAPAAIPNTSRLDEHEFLRSARVRFKVVRYRENQAWSSVLYSYAVQCRAEDTRRFPAISGMQDRGWITLSSALGEISAVDLAAIRHQFTVRDDVVVWTRGEDAPPRIFVGGCTAIREWSPASVERHVVRQAVIWPRDQEPAPFEAKPYFCANEQIDCRSWEFGGTRGVRYRNVALRETGLTFIAESTAFRHGALIVATDDWGKTWHYTETGEPTNESRD